MAEAGRAADTEDERVHDDARDCSGDRPSEQRRHAERDRRNEAAHERCGDERPQGRRERTEGSEDDGEDAGRRHRQPAGHAAEAGDPAAAAGEVVAALAAGLIR